MYFEGVFSYAFCAVENIVCDATPFNKAVFFVFCCAGTNKKCVMIITELVEVNNCAVGSDDVFCQCVNAVCYDVE